MERLHAPARHNLLGDHFPNTVREECDFTFSGARIVDDESKRLVQRWQDGDESAAAEIFERFADQLVGLVRKQLPPPLRARVGAEDVVQSALASFFNRARRGDFRFERSGDLLALLIKITINKTRRQQTKQLADKRDIRRETRVSAEEREACLEIAMLADAPTPADAAALIDELDAVSENAKPTDRRILELRLQDVSIPKIAEQVSVSERTVRRSLRRTGEELERRLFQVRGESAGDISRD
jgi:RNA polymerase sigma factor (sigma-70 family)